MRISLLFTCFMFAFTRSRAQDDILYKDDSLNQILLQNAHDTTKIQTYQTLIELWKNGDFNRTIEYIKKAIEFCEKNNPPIPSSGFKAQLGFQYMQVGDAVRSIEVFQQLKTEAEQLNEEYYHVVLAFIAMNYENLGDVSKALEYQIQASIIYERLLAHDSVVDRRGILGNPQKTAVYYLKLNQIDSALFYGLQGLNRLKKEPLNDYNRFFSWFIKTTLGDIYAKLKDYDQALSFYTQALVEIKMNNVKEDLPSVYLGLARLYTERKSYSLAKQYGIQAYLIADTLHLYPLVKESAFFLKQLYGDLKITDSALHFYEIAIAAKDTITNTSVLRTIDAMEYAEEKRNQEIKTLQQEKGHQKKQLYLFFGILIALFMLGLLYQKNRIKQKTNQILVFENKEIFLQRDRLLQDIERFEMQALKAQLNPHFIFNCLNSIDAFIYSNDKYKATTYLNKFAKLLRNILDGSYTNTVSINRDIQSLKLYIELEELRNNYSFKTSYDLDPFLEESGLEVPPLIVQPLVENAIIHGLKNRGDTGGILKISIKKVADTLQYIIEDNGVGRSAAHHTNQTRSTDDKSYGMTLAQSRIKMFNHEEHPSIIIEDVLNGEVIAGTKVTVNLKLKQI